MGAGDVEDVSEASSVMMPAVGVVPSPQLMVAVKSEGTAVVSVDLKVATSWVVWTSCTTPARARPLKS